MNRSNSNGKPEATNIFTLDKFDLDGEWVRQPELYHEAAVRLADARREFELAKAERDVVEADLARKIRTDPGSYGIEKLTEGVVRELTLSGKKHKRATQAVIDAQHAVGIAQAEVEALDHRKKALENEVQLCLADYFSRPRAPEGERERLQKVERRAAFRKGGKK